MSILFLADFMHDMFLMPLNSSGIRLLLVGGWYIATGQYFSLCENAAVSSLDAVGIGEKVLVRVQVECGREEVNNGEKQEKDRTRTQPTDNHTHIVDGMKME